MAAVELASMTVPEIDPMQAPSDHLNRRVFVGISAAATLAASAPVAAQEQLGHPHPALVAENDPGITVDRVTLQAGGASVPAYAAWPKSAASGTPGVVVIMHVWGVDTSIRDFVRRLAKAGFAAIAPDLYARFGAPNGDGATDYTIFRPYAQRLDPKEWLGEVRAAAQWLASKFAGTKIAITGFCMGGHLALVAAVQEGSLFSVVAPFYGSPKEIEPAAIHIPVCGSYGARDTGIPAQSVKEFEDGLTVPHDIRIYDEAGHAFFDDQRSSYVASAAADAWNRLLACFQKYLGKPIP